jgi:hypothetical protein
MTSLHREAYRLCSEHTNRQTAEDGRSVGPFPSDWIFSPAGACVMQRVWLKNVSDSGRPIPWPGLGFKEMKYLVLQSFLDKDSHLTLMWRSGKKGCLKIV